MGLRIKLLLLWFVLLLAPLSLLAGVGYVYIDSQLKKDATNYQLAINSSIAKAANGYFERLRYVTSNTAARPELQTLVTTDAPTAIQRSAGERVLSALVGSTGVIERYDLVRGGDFANPLLRVSQHDQSGPQLPVAMVRQLAAGGERISYLPAEQPQPPGVEEAAAWGHLITVVAVGPAGRGGYLVTVASVEPLLSMVAPQAGRETSLVFMDGSGRPMTQLGELPASDFPDGAALYQRTNSGFLDDYALGGRRYMLRLDALSHDFWLASLTDKDKLFAKKLPYIVIFVLGLVLTLALSGVVYNLFVNNLAIKPIQNLIHATRQIAKGNFKPAISIRSKDELGELAIAFRQMGQQLHHTSRRIRQLAYYDPLTQLPNRTTLRETLNRLLARADVNKTRCAVLFIDLDDFKKVNDRLGHEAGDELLVQIAGRLKNRLRQADILFEQSGVTSIDQLISRRGGDEFNAILSSIKAAHDAAVVAERIIQDLNEPFFVARSEIHVGASVGIAVFPDDGGDADTLLRNADLAMYEAKAHGKNSYHIYTSAINEQVHQRLALEQALQVAMVQNQFRLYYQPKVSLLDMSPVGFEALIRWQHPDKGMVLPSHFIPVAEESNLIRDIGNWILGESMQQIQLWDKKLPAHLRIAINISARQLGQVDLVEQLETMMQHFKLSPHRLEIELTETSVLQDEAMAIQHLQALRNLGVEISLDDFGTGYSSLSFLRKLPIDTVKIDRSFTANVTQNGEARSIVVSLLSLCRELRVKTIAEGIETTAQLQFLMEQGCDQGQGFLFSEPLPADEVLAFIREPSYIA